MGAFESSQWVIEMPEYTIQLSQPIPYPLPDKGMVAARDANGDRERDLLEKWAMLAHRGVEAYAELYDDTYVWLAGKLEEVPRDDTYDGQLANLELILHDGTMVRPSRIITYKVDGGISGASRHIPVIVLHPDQGSVKYRDFENGTIFGRQWHVFVGFNRSFDLAEIAELRYQPSDRAESVTR